MSLTSKQLLEAGIKPCELFGRILRGCQTIEEAKAVWEENQPRKVVGATLKPGTVWHWLCTNPVFQGMPSIEFNGKASNSEKKRWIENGSVIINGERAEVDDLIFFFQPIQSLVFFPKSDRKVTML